MKITVKDYRRTQTKHKKAKKGHGWTKLLSFLKVITTKIILKGEY